LVKKEMDFGWAAEFGSVRSELAKEEIGVIASTGRFSTQYLYALKDRGIERAQDLKGKTIAVPRNSISEFYLARFL
jgi:ABC-type nitrate/sulfonate/bicarbonate transport system substrate-binding protein